MDQNLIRFLFTIIGVIIGTVLTRILNRNRESVALAFDMHKEYLDMSQHRRNADLFIKKFPKARHTEIRELDENLSISLLMIMRFYQRLWLSIKYKQIKKKLVCAFRRTFLLLVLSKL